jgi:hypothetical protein
MRLTQLRPIGLVIAIALVAGAGLAAGAGRPEPAAPPPAPLPVAAARPAPAPAPAPAGPRRLALDRHDCPDVGRVAFSPDGSVVAVGGAKSVGTTVEEVLTLWDAATGRHLHTFRGDDAAGGRFAFSPDGKLLALPVTGTGEVVIRDVGSGKVVRRLDHKLVRTAEFSPDGKLLVTTSYGREGELHVWEAATGRRVYSPKRVGDERFYWSFFTPGGRLALGVGRRTVRSWDPATSKEGPPVTIAGEPTGFAIPSPDATQFLTTTAGRVHLHDAAGKVARAFGRDGDAFTFFAFLPHAKAVVAADRAGRVGVWEAATGAVRADFVVPDFGGYVPFVEPTPDGRHLVVQWSQLTGDETDSMD